MSDGNKEEILLDNNNNNSLAINASGRPSMDVQFGKIKEEKEIKKEDGEEGLGKFEKNENENIKVEFSYYGIIIVIIFFLLNFINGMHWITFAACAAKFGKFYHLTYLEVDMLSLIFMFLYICTSFPCSWLIDNKSVRLGLSLSALFLIIGSILKIFINTHIAFAYVGQILTALFQPAILNSPAKIAATWFNEKQRVLITSICCLSNTIGVMFGYIVHTFIMEENTVNPKIYKNDFKSYLIVEAVITIISGLIFIFFMREKPKNPPSYSQIKAFDDKKESFCEEIQKYLLNKNFICLFISLSCIVGYVNIFATIFNSYMALYKISDTHASYISGIANFFGIITAIIVAAIIDRYKNYYLVLVICNIISIILYIITTIVLETVKSKYLYIYIGILFTLVIGSAIPIYTSGMDLVCEITYGIGESTADGVIMFGNQALGIIGIFISDRLRTNFRRSKYLTNVFCILLFLISLICLLVLYKAKPDLERNERDKKKIKDDIKIFEDIKEEDKKSNKNN